MPDEAKTKEYPRWVTPHESHVVRAGSVSVPDFGQSHVLRDGTVQVLIENEEEEKRATEAKGDVTKANGVGDPPPDPLPNPAPARKPKSKEDN